ncbi:MAG: 2-C-methyl-D-erythritol 4-phosphate cytidylyltransferase [Bacteroidales bacterium]|nr:2-C-methyl-D-erythritol 4-phosphate cytidylyltransferase [Bacteroidales bacterium]
MDRKKYLIIISDLSSPASGLARLPMLGQRAVLHVAMEIFIRAANGITVIAVLPKSMMEEWRQYCYRKNFIYPQIIVPSGITRFHSISNALAKIPDNALVAVHDGNRPLLSRTLVESCFEKASRFPAVVPVIPPSGPLKLAAGKMADDGSKYYEPVRGTLPDQSLFYCTQTPQVFHSELLKKAFARAYDTSFTDAAAVVSTVNSVAFIDGERRNFAILTGDDLRMAAALADA